MEELGEWWRAAEEIEKKRIREKIVSVKKEAIEMKRSLNFRNGVGFAGFLVCMVGTLLYKFVAVNVKKLYNLNKIIELQCDKRMWFGEFGGK